MDGNQGLEMQRKPLLTSVSALVLLGSLGSFAQAQSVSDGYTIEVEGAVIFVPHFETRKTGDPTVATDDIGIGGQAGVRVMRDINDRMDLAFGASIAFVQGLDHAASHPVTTSLPSGVGFGSGSGGSSSLSSDINFQLLDVELGHTVETQSDAELRFFGGLRALHFGVNSDATLNDAGTGGGPPATSTITSVGVDSNFFGVGPRLGLEASQGLGSSAFGLTGSLSGAVLLGVTETDTSVSSVFAAGGAPNTTLPTGFNPGPDDSSFEAVFIVDADIGVVFDVTPTSSLVLGYQAQYFHNAGFDNFVFDDGSQHHLAHGAFLRWRTQL